VARLSWPDIPLVSIALDFLGVNGEFVLGFFADDVAGPGRSGKKPAPPSLVKIGCWIEKKLGTSENN
jgi:hypothetical protein